MMTLASISKDSPQPVAKPRKGILARMREAARMALGQDDGDCYECANG